MLQYEKKLSIFSSSSISEHCIVKVAKQWDMAPVLFTFLDRIFAWKVKSFHLDAIISVSRSSHILYLPNNSIDLFEVAKNVILCSRGIFRSVLKWFLGRGKFTACPSNSSKKSLQSIHSWLYVKSFRWAASCSSKPTHVYEV